MHKNILTLKGNILCQALAKFVFSSCSPWTMRTTPFWMNYVKNNNGEWAILFLVSNAHLRWWCGQSEFLLHLSCTLFSSNPHPQVIISIRPWCPAPLLNPLLRCCMLRVCQVFVLSVAQVSSPPSVVFCCDFWLF